MESTAAAGSAPRPEGSSPSHDPHQGQCQQRHRSEAVAAGPHREGHPAPTGATDDHAGHHLIRPFPLHSRSGDAMPGGGPVDTPGGASLHVRRIGRRDAGPVYGPSRQGLMSRPGYRAATPAKVSSVQYRSPGFGKPSTVNCRSVAWATNLCHSGENPLMGQA